MKIKIILFIVEGTSDEKALAPYLTKIIQESGSQLSMKITHGDKTSEPLSLGSKTFNISALGVTKFLEKLVTDFLNSTEIKKSKSIKAKNIVGVYYITDTDNCFHENTPARVNKRECFKGILKLQDIEIYQNDIIRTQQKRLEKSERTIPRVPFKTIFFARDLEAITINNIIELSSEDKNREAVIFGVKTISDNEFITSIFRSSAITTWDSYQNSYIGIKNCASDERACNFNNLLDEYEI